MEGDARGRSTTGVMLVAGPGGGVRGAEFISISLGRRSSLEV